MSGEARAIIDSAFRDVRRRAACVAVFRVASHAAFGAVFGTLLALTGDAAPWSMALLAVVGAVASALWTGVRLPGVDAGRAIERRFPECRNVLITADEILLGSLDATGAAADRVFTRAAETLAGIDARRAVGVAGPLASALLALAASAAVIMWAWT